ncbi:Glycosyl hydrolase family 61 domain containing protein [Rhypophila sp. PSN 637]
MHSITSKTLLAAVAGAASVAAHGHVTNIVINGVSYQNYDPFSHPYQQNPPTVVGFGTQATDNGFVEPAAFNSRDIICHRGSTNAGGHAVVAAGDNVFLQWDTWPESHHGPVIEYLAACGASGCEKADITSLDFFKISEAGLIDGSSAPGRWASDELISNGNGWMVKIPSNIKPGFYLLRHEIIALHSGNQPNGAQNYPQCINLEITGSGTATPSGVKGTALYTPNDAGILFNIYQPMSSYPVPGPVVISGGGSVPQSRSAIARSASAVVGTGGGGAAPTAAPTTTSNAAPVVPTTTLRTSTAAVPPPATTAKPTTSPAACGSAPKVTVTVTVKAKKPKAPRAHPRHVILN